MAATTVCCVLWSCLAFCFSRGQEAGKGPAEATVEAIIIKGHYFELELALDDETRRRGLMQRSDLRFDRGMLFVFGESRPQAFWMANCLIDLDIMFLDEDAKITALHTMQKEPPRSENETQDQYESRLPRYPSEKPAQFAIELKAGMLAELGVGVGAQIPIDAERLLKLLIDAKNDPGR